MDATGGKAIAEFLPNESREVIADETVQDTTRFLGTTQILIDATGVFDARLDGVSGDLVEGDALRMFQSTRLGDMPRDRFALAVGVGREVDFARLLGEAGEGGDDMFFSGRDFVVWLEVVLYVDRLAIALRQIANVSHRGDDAVFFTEIFLDGFRLRRRLNDDEFHRKIFNVQRSIFN